MRGDKLEFYASYQKPKNRYQPVFSIRIKVARSGKVILSKKFSGENAWPHAKAAFDSLKKMVV